MAYKDRGKTMCKNCKKSRVLADHLLWSLSNNSDKWIAQSNCLSLESKHITICLKKRLLFGRKLVVEFKQSKLRIPLFKRIKIKKLVRSLLLDKAICEVESLVSNFTG